MQISTIDIADVLIIQPKVLTDSRGYFFESFHYEKLTEFINYKINFVQENQSYSTKNVFRGFHFQTGTKEQAKLVRVVKGTAIDIIIDRREYSKTYGEVFQIELSETNQTQLFVPRGFAHGFIVTSEDAIFQYKCDNYYSKDHEGGINPFDESLKIQWPIDKSELIINERDLTWPKLSR